jgi:hypothetical protein
MSDDGGAGEASAENQNIQLRVKDGVSGDWAEVNQVQTKQCCNCAFHAQTLLISFSFI